MNFYNILVNDLISISCVSCKHSFLGQIDKHCTNLRIAFHSFLSPCAHPMYERLAFALSEVLVWIVQTDSHTLILISPISDLINNDDQHKAIDQYSFIQSYTVLFADLSRTIRNKK